MPSTKDVLFELKRKSETNLAPPIEVFFCKSGEKFDESVVQSGELNRELGIPRALVFYCNESRDPENMKVTRGSRKAKPKAVY